MQRLLSYTRRAVDDFQMIQPGDHIAVGVSGGKDSMTLMLALNQLRRFYPNPFRLTAICLTMGYEDVDYRPLRQLCEENDIPFVLYPTQIAQIIFDVRKEPNPCSLCAKLRRGILHNVAIANGCNKVALGHHMDDVIETFFLCLLHEGRISCFSPVTHLDRKNIHLIRPFIYLPEKEIKRYVRANRLPVIYNPCPANGHTQRQYVKELLADLGKTHKGLKKRLFRAVANSKIDGWERI